MALPFKVKAIHDYTSEHDDDLNFSNGQIITVTEKEDDDWYIGTYTDSSGAKQEGLFPKNFVEKYEPAAPPRPTRSRPKQPAPAATDEATGATDSAAAGEAVRSPEPKQEPFKPPVPPVEEEPPAPLPTPKSPEIKAEAPKPVPASKPQPPPVAEKPSSFKDRIAAFNKASAAPVAPVKPGGPAQTSFVKKPFVAPPPLRNSYVPPPKKETTQPKYIREEDPEIAEQRAQDLELAEKAGVVAHESQDAEAEEAVPTTSLQERIAALRKQQEEQALKRAPNPKPPKKPAAKPAEPVEEDEPQDDEQASTPPAVSRKSTELQRGAPPPVPLPAVRRGSQEPTIPEVPSREMVSDENDADQSGAGETTEDNDGGSTEVENDERPHPVLQRTGTDTTARGVPPPPPRKDVNQEEGAEEHEAEEEDEEEEIDPEVQRKNELRARMAKMSGGMGLGNVFGGPGPMVGGGSISRKPKPKPVDDDEAAAQEADAPPQRIPIMPLPGMGPRKVSQPEEDEKPRVGKEPEDRSLASTQNPPEKVADVEDLEQSPVDAPRAPPRVPQERPAPAAPRGAPPIPGNRPVPPGPEARPPPPPRDQSDEDEDEGEDEEPAQPPTRDLPKDLPARGAPPIPLARPEGPRSPPQTLADKRMSGTGPPPAPQVASSPEIRASRPPPVPGRSPTMLPPQEARPPPPPPPTAAPPSRQSTSDDRAEDSEDDHPYEGDYDTDIGSAVPHKDALKAHNRVPSADESTLSDATARSPPQLPPLPPSSRTLPPPPPPQHAPKAPRASTDGPRAMPPVPPPREPVSSPPVGNDDEDEYDPYRYDTPIATPNAHESNRLVQEESDPSLYIAQPPPQVPPPTSPPQIYSVPPPLPPQHQSLDPPVGKRQSQDVGRLSADVPRASMAAGRPSVEQSRPSAEQGVMAVDIPLDTSTPWWSYERAPPPPFQQRNDLLIEYEESKTSKRGGHSQITRDVYVLFPDYSQTTVTARYEERNASTADLSQRHEPPPARLRQDQLEEAHEKFGKPVAGAVPLMQNRTMGDGSPQALIQELFQSVPTALPPVGSRSFGALVYANMANASVQQHDEIRPGDIISFRNAKFQGKHGAMHAKYTQDVGNHVGVVGEWDGTKKKVRVFEQGRDGKKKVNVESYRIGDLRSGEVKVWRIVGRSYVGWDNN